VSPDQRLGQALVNGDGVRGPRCCPARLPPSAQVSGLGAGQLQNPHGATATARQTPVGTTSAWLLLDAGGAALWRALGLFRTNLTPAMTIRWRIDPTEGLIERAPDLTVTPARSATLAARRHRGSAQPVLALVPSGELDAGAVP
jgi:hypothetical protein